MEVFVAQYNQHLSSATNAANRLKSIEKNLDDLNKEDLDKLKKPALRELQSQVDALADFVADWRNYFESIEEALNGKVTDLAQAVKDEKVDEAIGLLMTLTEKLKTAPSIWKRLLEKAMREDLKQS